MSWIRPMQCTECRIKDEQLAARNAMVEAKVVLIKQLREDNDTLAETLRLEREKTKTLEEEVLNLEQDAGLLERLIAHMRAGAAIVQDVDDDDCCE